MAFWHPLADAYKEVVDALTGRCVVHIQPRHTVGGCAILRYFA
jgi:hypothetical protein